MAGVPVGGVTVNVRPVSAAGQTEEPPRATQRQALGNQR